MSHLAHGVAPVCLSREHTSRKSQRPGISSRWGPQNPKLDGKALWSEAQRSVTLACTDPLADSPFWSSHITESRLFHPAHIMVPVCLSRKPPSKERPRRPGIPAIKGPHTSDLFGRALWAEGPCLVTLMYSGAKPWDSLRGKSGGSGLAPNREEKPPTHMTQLAFFPAHKLTCAHWTRRPVPLALSILYV